MTTPRNFRSGGRLAVLALVLVAGSALSQPARAQQPGEDPIAERLFPPELVMRHADEIGLDERQRSALKDAVQKAQSRFLDAQWDMQAEQQKLVRLLEARPVEEGAVLAQVDRVLGLEREVKRTHLALLVRIKNLLSGAQQEKLQELRRRGG